MITLYKGIYFLEVDERKTDRITELKADGWGETHPSAVQKVAKDEPAKDTAPDEAVTDAQPEQSAPPRKGAKLSPVKL